MDNAGFSDRIKKVIKHYGITNYKLAKKLGVSNPVIANWMNGRSLPNVNNIYNLLIEYPNIDANWLILGTGEMEKGKATLGSVEIAKIITMLDNSLARNSELEKKVEELGNVILGRVGTFG